MLDFTPDQYSKNTRILINHLIMASEYGFLDSVEEDLQSLNQEMDKEPVRESCVSGLITAASKGHLDVVNRLLQIASVRERAARDHNQALCGAAKNGYLEVVNRLLEIPKVLEEIKGMIYALQAACDSSHLDVVNRLLEVPAVCNNAAADHNRALSNAAVRKRHDVVTRLLQESNVADYLEQHKGLINEPQEFLPLNPVTYEDFYPDVIRLDNFFKEIDEQSISRIEVARCLSQACGNEFITNHILALAYHDVLCGKSVCTKPAQTQEEGLITCTVINQFRNYALGAKERAQAKLGTQATTSTSTNSSIEPSKKARHN